MARSGNARLLASPTVWIVTLIRRAVECATITYDQLTAGAMPAGAARLHRPPATVGQPALAG